jgi:hypothetical protein
VEFFIQAEKFVLPDQVKIEALDNIILRRKMIKKFSKLMPLEVLGRVLESVPDDSPLRTLVLDFVCSDFDTRDKFMDCIAKELERKDSNFDIMAFLRALKERYHDTKKNHFGLLYDPTMERRRNPGNVNINDMPRY